MGTHETGAGALDELRVEGVDTSAVAVLDGVPTGVALIVVDGEGENQIAVGAGANGAVAPAAVAARNGLRAGQHPPAGLPCVLNPAPAVPEVVALLAAGPILTPNRSE